ncbi:hypothetical protein [Luteibacter sp. SG786]|uniref:hypothetical protein n=1 Tax=Luteibacter sp. SG786 TaxID=2587130 RepID=UPI0014229D2C|nr:hypothetical protein [Luteibacter sp. SG786]NII56555.1 hypothetical protein [Luteibacter sp. SG786]
MLPVQLAMPLALMVGAAIAATTESPCAESARSETPQARADRARAAFLDHGQHGVHVRLHERRHSRHPHPLLGAF